MRGRDVAAGSVARRVSAPSWRDPRLVIGLVLVLASVVLGARVVGAAQQTVGVWAAAHAVGAGQPLTSADLRVVQVHLDEGTTAAYLVASGVLDADLVALRGLTPGELVPRSALGRAADLASRPITVPVAGNVPQGVEVGALVDLWVVPAAATSGTGATADVTEPERLVEAAEVSAVVTGGGALGARAGADVQVLVPEALLPAALRAVSDEDGLVLVPVPGAGGARS